MIRQRTHVPRAEARFGGGLNVRDKSRTYLKGNSNGNSEKQIPCGDDNKKGDSNNMKDDRTTRRATATASARTGFQKT